MTNARRQAVGPWIQQAVFCLGTAGEGTDLRPVDVFNAVTLPGILPQLEPDQEYLYELETVLFMRFVADGAVGPRKLSASFEAPDGVELGRAEDSVQLVGYGAVAWPWRIRLATDQVGTFWAEVRVADRVMTRVPLEVRSAQVSP